jgi:hypothetical protein
VTVSLPDITGCSSFNIFKTMVSMFLSVSKPAPDWEGSAVINGEFKQLKLSDYRGKYLVLLFYPLDL